MKNKTRESAIAPKTTSEHVMPERYILPRIGISKARSGEGLRSKLPVFRLKKKPSDIVDPLTTKIRKSMVLLLNQELADLIDLGLQAKQAHWNVKGPHFIGLHELFDKVAEELEILTDALAERAVEIGGIALGTSQAVARMSRLPPYSESLASGKGHVEALAASLAQFGASTRSAIATSDRAGDADTSDLFTEVSRSTDKLLWQVLVHVQSSE